LLNNKKLDRHSKSKEIYLIKHSLISQPPAKNEIFQIACTKNSLYRYKDGANQSASGSG